MEQPCELPQVVGQLGQVPQGAGESRMID